MLVHRNQRRGSSQRGAFTLIEVLVVVAIIVILAGGATVLFLNRLEESKFDLSKDRARSLKSAIEQYEIKHGAPNSVNDLVPEYIKEDGLYDAYNNPMAMDVSNPTNPIVSFTSPRGDTWNTEMK
jgi:prepilin-type N-terminal cleavage/methylation domain-containing protein